MLVCLSVCQSLVFRVHESIHILIDAQQSHRNGDHHNDNANQRWNDSALLGRSLNIGSPVEQYRQHDEQYSANVPSNQGKYRIDIREERRHANDDVGHEETSKGEDEAIPLVALDVV